MPERAGTSWRQSARRALVSGAVASVLSAAVLALCGRLEGRSAAGPLNGPSQWVYGRGAAYRRQGTLRHTLTGYAIHHLMATGWALFHELLAGSDAANENAARRWRRAALTAATANFVDYQLTPKRLQPGFDVQLSRASMALVYAAFAVGLAMASHRTTHPRTIANPRERGYRTDPPV